MIDKKCLQIFDEAVEFNRKFVKNIILIQNNSKSK